MDATGEDGTARGKEHAIQAIANQHHAETAIQEPKQEPVMEPAIGEDGELAQE